MFSANCWMHWTMFRAVLTGRCECVCLHFRLNSSKCVTSFTIAIRWWANSFFLRSTVVVWTEIHLLILRSKVPHSNGICMVHASIQTVIHSTLLSDALQNEKKKISLILLTLVSVRLQLRIQLRKACRFRWLVEPLETEFHRSVVVLWFSAVNELQIWKWEIVFCRIWLRRRMATVNAFAAQIVSIKLGIEVGEPPRHQLNGS